MSRNAQACETAGRIAGTPWRRYLAVAALACAGAVLSAALFAALRSRERDRMRVVFERAARDRVSALDRSIQSNLLILRSLRSFYAASQELSRSGFRQFVAPLLLLQKRVVRPNGK